MKRSSIAILLVMAFAVCFLAGCGSAGSKDSTSHIKMGSLTAVNLTSEEFSASLQNRSYAVQLTAGQGGAAFEYSDDFRDRLEGAEITAVYYDTLSSMMMALQTGEIEVFAISKTAADYLCAQNEAFDNAVPVTKDGDRADPFYVSYSMMLMSENASLCAEIEQVIADMKSDGTLNRLSSDQIYGLTHGTEPEAVSFDAFDGGETIRVAVTGDLPPMDYISANGTPAGFNTALLAEMGSRLGKNIELVSVDAGARASALAGGVVDVVFWARTVTQEGNEADELARMDVPEGAILTEPYFTDMAAVVFAAD